MLAIALMSVTQAQPAPPTPPVAPVAAEAPATPEAPGIPASPEWPATPNIPAAPAGVPGAARFLLDEDLHITESSQDLFALASTINVMSPVEDNAFVMAQDLTVSAPLQGDLMGMAEEITIDAPVYGDAYVLAKEVRITKNGQVHGNIHVMAAELDLEGPVAGSLNGEIGRLSLAAPIAGNVDLDVGEVTVISGARIAGNLDYTSKHPVDALDAIVVGEIHHQIQVDDIDVEIDLSDDEEEETSILSAAAWWTMWTGWEYIAKLFVGLSLLFLGGTSVTSVARRVVDKPGTSLGIGSVFLGLLPVLSVAALITVIAFPLGLVGLTIWGLALYVAQFFAAQALGDFVLRRFRPGTVGSPYISFAVGLTLLVLICSVPWVGTLAWIGASCVGAGAGYMALRGMD